MFKLFKFASYISSLILVSIYVFFLFSDKEKIVSIPYINIKFNIYTLRFVLLIIVLAMLIYFFVYLFIIIDSKKQNNIVEIEIIELQQEKFNSLNFLFSNILPVVTLNLNEDCNVILCIVLLIVLGYIFIRNDMFYINPLYDIVGVRIYEALVLANGATIPRKTILISRKKIYGINNVSAFGVLKNNIVFINSLK